MTYRTFAASEFQRANAQWATFTRSEWRWVERIAKERGMLYPPSGSEHDDRDSADPTQRAIVWRCLMDNPEELRRILYRSRSWNGVVAGIIGLERRLRLDVDDQERDEAFDRAQLPDHREAAMSLAAIFRRIEESM